jgi:hypothetical protein
MKHLKKETFYEFEKRRRSVNDLTNPMEHISSLEPRSHLTPHRWCFHLVVVVGLVCTNDPESYAGVPTGRASQPDRSKGRYQTKRSTFPVW